MMENTLTKVDSAVQGLSMSPPKHGLSMSPPKEGRHKRTSSSAGSDVRNINDLEAEKIELQLAPETQKTGWKINTSTTTVEDKDILKKFLTTPPVRKIDLHFPLGLEVTARNLKGVTIKDALEAIHKAFKKRADDELDLPYLKGFEWDKEESWTRLIVHLQKESSAPVGGQHKKKKKHADDA